MSVGLRIPLGDMHYKASSINVGQLFGVESERCYLLREMRYAELVFSESC